MVFSRIWTRAGKPSTLKRRQGGLADSLVGLLCIAVSVSSILSVTLWISAKRAETRASVYLSLHNLDCMERLREEAHASSGDLLNFYNSDQYSSSDITTDITCTSFDVEGVNCYTVLIKSRLEHSPYHLSSKYVLTSLVKDNFDPEVNVE